MYSVLVKSYDDPRLWVGHSSLMEEIHEDLKVPPKAIFTSVGGGRLLGGILVGMNRLGWTDGIPFQHIEESKLSS